MNNFFSLSDEQKRMVLTQAAAKVGLPVEAAREYFEWIPWFADEEDDNVAYNS